MAFKLFIFEKHYVENSFWGLKKKDVKFFAQLEISDFPCIDGARA